MNIDVHSHIYPESYIQLLSSRDKAPKIESQKDGKKLFLFQNERLITGGARNLSTEYYSIEGKIISMGQHSISKAVLSLGNPWIDFLTGTEAVYWAEKLNAEIKELCGDYSQFRALAVLPLQEIKKAVVMIENLAAENFFIGFILGTRPAGRHLDDPYLNPLWDAVENTGKPLFLHPSHALGIDWMHRYGHAMVQSLGFSFETTTAVTRLILGGVLDRFPSLRFILAYAGGTLPALHRSINICVEHDSRAKRNIRQAFSEYVKKLYFDTITDSADTLRLLLSTAGADKVLYGTDHPFDSVEPKHRVEMIKEGCGTAAESKKLLYKNGEQWFNRGSLP
jgi:predicted TIM-barrel fold metal-dependent hydrolase